MQSPFRVFRKYQKEVMAVMVFVALILFGIGDTLMKMVGGPSGPRGSKVLVETNIGNLTQMQMQTLMQKRRIIQRFIQTAFMRSHPDLEKEPYAGYMMSMTVQQYGFGRVTEPDLLESWLYRHEARKLGIVVTDKQVEEYIRGVTQRKLSTKKFEEVIREMQLGARELFDMVRDELLAVTAYRMKQPVVVASPEKYWEYYQALNTREKIEVAAVPVKDFTSQAPEPTPAQIAKLFEEHKDDDERAFEGEFKPGFRQPRRVKLQYLELAFAEIDAKARAAGPVTDKEIEDYYEANKDIESRFQEGEAGLDDDASPLDPGFAPEKDEKMPADESDAKPDSADKPADKPADKDKDDKPKQESDKPSSSKPEDAKPDEAKNDDKPDCAPGVDDEAKKDSAAESENAAKPPAEPAADNDKPEAKKPAEDKSKEEDEKDVADEAPKAPAVGPRLNQPHAPPKIKYKPLDDELREGIRETILYKRSQKMMKDIIAKARDAMSNVAAGFAVSTKVKLTEPNAKELAVLESRSDEELHKIAEKFGMKFDKTALVSQLELSEIPGLGKAVEPGSYDRMSGESTPIFQQAFDNEALCRVFESENLESSNVYLCWKVEDAAMHVPELQEPGVRDQVVAAFKRQLALPLAEKRANELAERARKGGKSLTEALSGEAVTGDAKEPELKVEESKEFSFWRESTAPNPMMRNRQPPVQLDDPGVVKNPSRKFMQTVFNELGEGDVGVALNGDASIYYVVKVISRRPADREAFKDVLTLFAQNSPYAFLAQLDERTVAIEEFERRKKKYAIKWHNIPGREQMQMTSDDE